MEFSLNDDTELIAHFDLHAVLQPHGRHIEVGNFTLERGRLGLGYGRVLHGFGDLKSCSRKKYEKGDVKNMNEDTSDQLSASRQQKKGDVNNSGVQMVLTLDGECGAALEVTHHSRVFACIAAVHILQD